MPHSSLSTPIQTITSYIQAVYDFETSAEGFSSNTMSPFEMQKRIKDMDQSGELDSIETRYTNILKEFCTPREYHGGFHLGGTPEHHPEQELITKVEPIDTTHTIIWTRYEPFDSYPRVRRYHLELHDNAWLIQQHYLIDEEGLLDEDKSELPEI